MNEPALALADLTRLLHEQKTLLLATQSANGEAEASYAPYVFQDEAFHVFVSQLAGHTGNMLRHPQASVMLIEDEESSRNLFARLRLICQCRVSELDLQSPSANAILNTLQARCGNTVEMLRSLPDFHLLRLQPEGGTLVRGFGQAWRVNAGLALQERLTGR